MIHKSIVVVNMLDFPCAYVDACMQEFEWCGGTRYLRVYPTNACAVASLHDLLIDAPCGTLLDEVRFAWSKTTQRQRTIFHHYRSKGYETHLYGPFGVDALLDSNKNLQSVDVDDVMDNYGVDVFDTHDYAFDNAIDTERFAGTLGRIGDLVSARTDRDKPLFIFATIEICPQVRRALVGSSAKKPLEHRHAFDGTGEFNNAFFPDAVKDDPRQSASHSSTIEGCVREAMMHDFAKGQIVDTCARRIVANMMQFAWRRVRYVSKTLSTFVQRLDRASMQTYITSTSTVGSFEHGTLRHVPWESCQRSFLVVRSNERTNERSNERTNERSNERTDDQRPCSLMILKDMLLNPAAETPSALPPAFTLGASVSWLFAAKIPPVKNMHHIKRFFTRCVTMHQERRYSLTLWFSVHQMLADDDGGEDVDEMVQHTKHWQLPSFSSSTRILLEKHSLHVFELDVDIDELHNIANDVWMETACAHALLSKAADSATYHGFNRIRANIPRSVDVCVEVLYPFALHRQPQSAQSGARVSSGTQTEVPSLLAAVVRDCGREMSQRWHDALVRDSACTLFVNKHDASDVHIKPLVSPLDADMLLLCAKTKTSLATIDSQPVFLSEAYDGNVVINGCTVLLNNVKKVPHFGGTTLIYNYIKHDADDASSSHSSTSNVSLEPRSKKPILPEKTSTNRTIQRIRTTKIVNKKLQATNMERMRR